MLIILVISAFSMALFKHTFPMLPKVLKSLGLGLFIGLICLRTPAEDSPGKRASPCLHVVSSWCTGRLHALQVGDVHRATYATLRPALWKPRASDCTTT